MNAGNVRKLVERASTQVSLEQASVLEGVRNHAESLFGPRRGLPFLDHEALLQKPNRDLMATLVAHRQTCADAAVVDLGAWSQIDADTVSQSMLGGTVDVELSSLIGAGGTRAATLVEWSQWLEFLRPIDSLGFIADLADFGDLDSVTASDLGTLMDLNLIAWAAWAQDMSCVDVFAEVGGGYGRLALGFFQSFPDSQSRWVLIDAIPSVLSLAYSVGVKVLGFNRISVDLDGSSVESKSRLTLCPSWKSSATASISDVDFFVNIESFQEMHPDYVDHWCQFADAKLSSSGVAYISNGRTYINQVSWPMPDSLNVQLVTETPRSFVVDHPTVVYAKHSHDSTVRFSALRSAVLNSRWREIDTVILRRSSRLSRSLIGLAGVAKRVGVNPYRLL